MAFLRRHWGIMISIYMDDMILQAPSPETAYLHAQITILVFMSLGWEVNWEKSSLIPSHKLTHLGFDIDTSKMTASCPKAKVDRFQSLSRSALSDGQISVHNCEKIIGLMESVRPVTPLAALHYRSLQKQLLIAKRGKRIPSLIITLSQKSLSNLQWWASPSGFQSHCTASL